ncbi:MAG: outer membrane protein assembly factor BamD [Gemmatimonadaceae bacterium]|nr:outer membrane protein assembly factor BamD [Gemmatimonadaceae bacterium]
MGLHRKNAFAAGVALVALSGCLRTLNLRQYPNNEALYGAGVEQLRERKWDFAVQIFEKLTLELPARDTLLPLSHFHLAAAYAGRGEHLLAAQSYARLAESFATDTLADDALYRAGREYQEMWRKPVLDPLYGGEAASTFELVLGLYPDSEFADSARRQLAVLQEWFATKDYESGMHYLRRKAWDSAIIYMRDVVTKYPETARSRDAYLRLAQAYEAIRYKDDKADVCKTLREKYPADPEVASTCGPVPPRPVVPGDR